MNRNKSVIFMSIVRLVVIAVLISGALAALPPAATSAAAPDAPQAGTTCLLLQPAATIGKDAYIKQEKPDEIRGGDPELRVKNESGKLMRSLLQFDLSGFPSGAVVTSATLSLFVKDASGGAYTINAHQVTSFWNEPQVTWKARDKAAKVLWTNLGGDYNSAVVSSAVVDDTKNIWRTWDLTSLATTWLSNPASNLGVILEAPAGSPHGEKKFKSSDDGTAAQRPKLEVCYSSGVIVDPDNSGSGVPGLTRTYAHIVHVGNITSAVNLSAASSQGWTTRVLNDVNGNGVKDAEDTPITATPVIGPNADYPILVQVDVPLSAVPGMSDATTVTATAQSNGSSDTAKDTTQVGKQVDVQPDNSRYATAGSVIFYGHQIINNGDTQDCLTASATSSQGWQVLLWQDLNGNGVHETSNPVEPPLSGAICINPGGHFDFVAEVRVPAGATAGTVDRTLITATSNNDPSKTGQAVDTTQVFVNAPPVIDGKYDTIYDLSPDASQVCYNANGTLFGKLSTFYQPTADAVYMVLAIDKDFVDNTYGTNAIGWPGGHTFGNLTGSDHAQFYGFDANGATVLDFKLDYLTSSSGTPSGYASLGVSGGEGRMNLGSAASIQAWGTSLEYSLNKTGYCSGGACPGNITVNSPATNAFYTPNPTYPAWIYDVIYEVKIAKTAFGAAGFGSLEVPYIHASPSKVGTNTIYATPGPCPGEIGDTVWKDLNGNGVQDAGETGIDGVQVKLYRDNGDGVFNAATDTLVGTQTTSAGGHYLFQNLAADDYFVDVVDATVPTGYQTTTYNDPTPIISLGEGQSYLDADFGYRLGPSGGSIGDLVWNDANQNGIQDTGEVGIPGVTVRLYDGTNNLLATTTTDGNGHYLFANRQAGSYQVEFRAPSGYTFSSPNQGSDPAKDSDANPITGRTVVFYLAANAVDLTWDAGLSAPVSVCVTLQPDAATGKDAYIKQENINENRGSDSELRVKTENGKLMRSLLQFDLSGLPANAAVTSATLSLYVKDASGGAVTINAHQVTQPWNEDQVTWNSRDDAAGQIWTVPGGDYNSAIVGSAVVDDTKDVWRSWNLTSLASAWVNNPANNYGVILEAPVTDPKTEKKFKSSDDGTANDHPKLEVCYTELMPDLQISKTLNTPGPIYVGQELNFTIRITNTGQTTLAFLPLRDWYDATKLQFLGATPAPDVAGGGALTWYDLTASLGALAPGQTAAVVVRFRALDATASLAFASAAAETGNGAQATAADVMKPAGGQPSQLPNALTPDSLSAVDSCGYPYSSTNNPLTSVVFNESEVLRGFEPVDGGAARAGERLKVWYNDEHALTLGVREVQVKTSGGTTTTPYTVTPLSTNPGSAIDPQVGTTALSGNQAGTDIPGRPMWPAIFITDVTTDPNNRSGDWQFGGTPLSPHAIFGTWKGAVRVVDSTRTPAVVTITPDADPAKNNWNLDGGDPPPAGLVNEGFGAEVRWDVDRLVTEGRLIPGHTYRFQFMVHDGDQNKTGGDVGEACTTIAVAAAGSIGDRVWYDANVDKVQQPGEPGLNGVKVNLYGGTCPVMGRPTGTPLKTQVTIGDGAYDFGGLAAGAYCVAVDASTLPAGFSLTTANEPLTVNLAQNQDYNTADFGYQALCPDGTPNLAMISGAQDAYDTILPDHRDYACVQINPALAAVGDRVWDDKNGNGIQDPGEPGIPNVQVELFDVGGNFIGTTATDANGIYGFNNLMPGDYYLQFGLPDGYVFTAQYQGGDPAKDSDANAVGSTDVFSLAPGQTDPTRDAGAVQVASLGDFVWQDLNMNGIQDAGEPGVPGVNVNLYDGNGIFIDPTTTDASGHYLFSGLIPGDYIVEFVAPAGSTFTLPNQGSDPAKDSDADVITGQTGVITLSPGENDLTWDAGLVPSGAIGDFVWYDTNGDGVENVGEPGIPNVTIDLYLGGTKIATTTTDADGGYLFPDLGPGTYTVDVTDLNGVLAGLTHVVANQSLFEPATVTLGMGEVNKDVDFGYVKRPPSGFAIIGDTVWYDVNADGIQQPGEPGIPGVQVCATPKAGGAAICDTTDSNGHYLVQVPAGSYNVAPANPPLGYTATTPVPHAVTVAAGDQYLEADFGYDSPGLGTIGNLVFWDKNTPAGNGIFDAGDTPLSGVSVDLIRDVNGNKAWDAGEPIIATVTTGSVLVANNGNYLFSAVPAGNYLVHVSDTNAVLTDYSKSILGATGADNNNQADPYAVSLPSGGANLTADFGYEKGGGTHIGGPDGVIGNQIWIEYDGNGLFDPVNGDFGQPGVSVELFKDGQPYGTTTSGASGRYAFLRLPAGNYTVSVSDMAGVLLSYHETQLGPNPGQDNNNQAQPYAIVLPDGGYNPTADFGYTQPGGIGDYVWYDANGDGIQNVFEPGIGNVTLKLYRDNGDNVFNPPSDTTVGIETTGADGGYFFNNLGPGVYFVDVTDSNGVLAGLIHTTGPESQPDPAGPITLQVGQVYRDADFGYVKTPISGQAIIGDTVWYDGNGDGVRNPGEPGIAGVQVCATPAGGGAAICRTTNSNGEYLIEVPAGTYNVAPTNPPAGATATTPVPHGPVTVSAGDQYLDADFGYNSPNLGSISGTTWNDTGGDGLLDAGEPRIPGVSVDLIRDLNGDGFRNPGEPVIATVTSDPNGNYTFSGLPAGDYLVIVSDTQNVLADYSPAVPGPNPGLDNNNQEQPYAIKLAAGENDPTADFGYVQTGTPGKMGVIGNQVWYEADGNGIYNPGTGDLGIAGVTVRLYREGVSYGTTTTGAGGDYVFTSLPSGTYTVTVTDNAGVLKSYIGTVLGPNPGQDNNNQKQPYTIGLPANGMNMTADFGYTRPGAIGDFVWYDTNRDGIQDIGEPGIPNVTLDLYRDGVKIASTTTDADGGYLFPGLRPGSYIVDVTDLNSKLTGMTHMVANQSQPDPTAPISLGAGEVNKDADFGYVRVPNVGKAIIGDTVWYDANGDGIQQPNEPGIPGTQVCATPTGGGTPLCAITDANGIYRVEVPAGSYNVAPTNPPAGYTATTLVPRPVTVTAGQQYLDADFGYRSTTLPGKIGNLVFLDKGQDGVFNGSDSALAGVSVDLIRDSNGNKAWDSGEPIIATETTTNTLDANNGNYLFPGVPAGNYLVHVSDTNAVLTDYIKSKLGSPGADNHNQADPYAISLSVGGANLTADFGYYQATRPDVGVIGNQVWIEKVANGLFGPAAGDIGQAGVTVELYKNGQPYGVSTTGASGDYSFVGLPAGTYTVTVTDDFGVLTGYAVTTLGPNPGQDNNNQAQPYTVALPTAGYNLTADFGYILPKSSIGDTVFYDDNRNGVQDPSEVGIPGIVVKLYTDGTGTCDTLVATATTNSNGKYLFANLSAGHYCVIVPQTGGENPFLNNFQLSAGTNPHSVNLAADQNYLDADFGFAGRGTIRGVVFYDWNQNGVQDLGEGVIPNTQVCLFADANGDGVKDSPTPVACTTTDAQGFYNFYNLLPGTYLMEQTLPGGLVNTTPLVIPAQLVLNQGTGISDNNNFGDLLYVRLGDFVYIDLNGNGVQDPGETTGISGVPLQIIGTNIAGQPVNVTVTTVNGIYLESTLIPGVYTVSAPLTYNGYARTSPASKSTTLTTSVTQDLTLDFGYQLPTGVQVQSFTASSANSQVLLTWEILGTAPDGFKIWRADNAKGIDEALLTPDALQPGENGTFQYVDVDVTVGMTYWYWLENPADGQRFGPTSVTAQLEAPVKMRLFLPFVTR